MSDPVDTGFDAVIAGEVYVAPDEKPSPSEPPLTAPVSEETLTDEGKDAAKALVALPHLTYSDLASLARDVAMNIKERHVVLKDHGLTQAQYDYLEAYNEFYINALKAACLEWHAPLSTAQRISVEAQAILEDSLLDLGARMRNKSEGLPGVIEAAKFFSKIAGVGERAVGSGDVGERFVINIDLGGDQKLTLSTAQVPQVAAPPDYAEAIQQIAQGASPLAPLQQEPQGAGAQQNIPRKPKGP